MPKKEYFEFLEVFFATPTSARPPSRRNASVPWLPPQCKRKGFAADYNLFKKLGELGRELADLHLLKSPALDLPVAKYQGSSDSDRVEKITYKEDEQRIYINKDKYFEGIAPDVWNYHIGGYQVLNKYLKDRKGRNMDDAPHYCRIVTALSKTLKIQKKIDEIYPEAEKDLIDAEERISPCQK